MRRPRRPLAAGWYVAGGTWMFLSGLAGTLYLALCLYGLSLSAWWWAGKCFLAALCCWNVACLTLRWLLKDALRRSKKQAGQRADSLDSSQADEVNWP